MIIRFAKSLNLILFSTMKYSPKLNFRFFKLLVAHPVEKRDMIIKFALQILRSHRIAKS